MTTVHPPPSGRHALRGAVICGLVLTAGATGPVPALLRAVTPLLAGRGLARARSLRAIGWLSVHTLLIWALSFSPLVLLASPEVLRTYAIAVGLALALRGLSVPATLAFGGGALAAAAAVADLPPHFGLLGGLEYALGASWPRGWSDVARVVGLFLLGSAWERSVSGSQWGARKASVTVAGVIEALSALGRMPLTVLAVHSLAMLGIVGAQASAPRAVGAALPLTAAALAVEGILARRWLERRPRGPLEQGIQSAWETLLGLGTPVRAAFVSHGSRRPCSRGVASR